MQKIRHDGENVMSDYYSDHLVGANYNEKL